MTSCWSETGVLGANDGLVSVASLMMGVGGGSQDSKTLLLSGVAGLVGGALSMAAGGELKTSVKMQTRPKVSTGAMSRMPLPHLQEAKLHADSFDLSLCGNHRLPMRL